MLLTKLLLLLTPAAPLLAQPAVAPTPETTGPARGQNTDGYNIVQSWETGYRFRTLDGNYGKYRSDVNFGNGIRLLGSRFSIHSREGRGKWFDELVLTTQGLGNDPYQMANFRLQKNRLYRYDLLWRLNEYFNPALNITGGQHLLDTRRRIQDHDLTLFPQSSLRFFLGYSRNTQTGPALSTIQLFDSRGDEFPLFTDVRRTQNEFRLGAELNLSGFRFNVLHGWENFRDDTNYTSPTLPAGNNPTDSTTLNNFQRAEPYHGNSPYWRLTLFRETGRWFSANARFTYVEGRRDFILAETALGTDRLGAVRNRQVMVSGNGRRPVAAGNLTLSLFPTDRLTITNHTAFHNTRMEGDNTYLEVNNSLPGSALLNFEFLGIRTITNLADIDYRVRKWLGLYGGWHYSTRRIRSRQGDFLGGSFEGQDAEQNNRLHSGVAGIRLKPLKPLTLNLDAEIGRADRPVFPISERNYHVLAARIEYRTKTLLLTGMTRANYNFNSVSLFAHSSRARTYAANASWTPLEWFSFDAGYQKLHLDTLTGIAYFVANRLTPDQSLYFSNIHAVNFSARFAIAKRADLFLGFNRAQDTGDGRARPPLPSAAATPIEQARAAFFLAQTYPLSFDSPLARLSIRLHNKLRWNFGYQYYRYSEDFFALQNYRAHTGYTSVLWSF